VPFGVERKMNGDDLRLVEAGAGETSQIDPAQHLGTVLGVQFVDQHRNSKPFIQGRGPLRASIAVRLSLRVNVRGSAGNPALSRRIGLSSGALVQATSY